MDEAMAGRKLTADMRLIKCDKYLEDVIECKELKF